MNLFQETNELLKKHGIWLTKNLGQNFLTSEESLQAIIDAADIQTSDTVLEIGPGSGILSRAILKKTKHLTCIEKDENLKEILKDLPVQYGDGLKFNPDELKGPYKLIANIPYYITSPLINHFLKDQYLRKDAKSNPPVLIVLLIQKEVAEKICNPDKESYLSLNVKSFGSVEIIAEVPRDNFLPPPKVDSAIIRIKVEANPILKDIDLKKYFSLISQGFSSPRKKLSNNLKSTLKLHSMSKEDLQSKSRVDLNQRAENLKIEDWVQLLKILNT